MNGLWKWTYQPPQGSPALWADAGWQSAQALRALIRYLQGTGDTQPAYQDLIARTYLANLQQPQRSGTGPSSAPPAREAVWWGLAWAQAARYELYDRHDRAAAARYLTLAERDACAVAGQPNACLGTGVSLSPYGLPQTLASAFVDAVADWTQATRAVTYDSFLLAQGRAVIANAASDGGGPTHCQTPRACQIDFYWSRRVTPTRLPVQLTPGSQQSGLAALTGALVAARTGSSRPCRPDTAARFPLSCRS